MAETQGDERLSFTVRNLFGNGSEDFHTSAIERRKASTLWTGVTKIAEHPPTDKINVSMLWNSKKDEETLTISAKSTGRFMFATTIATDLDSSYPARAARQRMKEVKAVYDENPDSLWESHRSSWDILWNESSIDVVGDDALAQTIYGSLYYIVSSIRDDWPYGLSPGGLASDAYLGHTFWDQETWMYPNLLLLYQDLAKSCLEYRFNRLTAARKRAASKGYKGAMFPWESSFSGFEVCPEPDPYSKYEHHITGDIGFAVQQFWMAAKDKAWFEKYGLDMTEGVAAFWSSRANVNKATKDYVINHVQGPDEYYYDVNNSVYTNVVAKINLRFASEIVDTFGHKAPAAWKDISDNLYIPFDDDRQYHPEFDGYQLNETVKQADVILLGFPLMFPMKKSIRKNDLRLYEESTDAYGPAMTWSMFAIGWLECGMHRRAADNFKRGYANVREPFKVWTETPQGGAVNFITGAGGFLQSVLFGYGGLKLHTNRLSMTPQLPPNTTEITFNGLTYLGNKILLKYDKNTLTATVLRQIPPFHKIFMVESASGKRHSLTVGTKVVLTLRQIYFTST